MQMKYSEQLRATARELERRPWMKGEYAPGIADFEELAGDGEDEVSGESRFQAMVREDPQMPCCAIGASFAVVDGGISEECLTWVFRKRCRFLVDENDAAGDVSEVVRFLDESADFAEAEGL